jgi:hypothetical protein
MTGRMIGPSRILALTLLTGAALGPSMGCRVDDADVHRWESTERGPEKLVAVLEHDKYAIPLRIEAAMSLVRMRPRNGRRIGTELMTDALSTLPTDSRGKVVDGVPAEQAEGMAPQLIKQIQLAPPVRKADGTMPEDKSIPFKDAAFALLTHDPPLVTSEATKTSLSAALTQWCQADFETRLENPTQQFGIEQIMRFLGPTSVKGLPALVTEQSTKVDRIVGLVADLGDDTTKLTASQNLVALAKINDSPAWFQKQTAIVQKADDDAKQKVTKDQLQAQVLKYQDQELTKVFSSMKRLGGKPVVEYLIQYSADPRNSPERRKTALAALEGRIDKSNVGDVERIFVIAKDENTPDEVRDLAFARLGELPKEQVVPRLYTLFGARKWKVRWVAAQKVLGMISPRQIPEFMSHLPVTSAAKMGMNEPLTYGPGLVGMEHKEFPAGEPKVRDVVMPYLNSNQVGAKLTALGYFYQGKKGDTGFVQGKGADTQVVAKCEKDDDCHWECDVPKPGSATEKESKTIATVGEFARECIAPSMVTP